MVAALVVALTTVAPPAQACNNRGNCANAPGQNKESAESPGRPLT